MLTEHICCMGLYVKNSVLAISNTQVLAHAPTYDPKITDSIKCCLHHHIRMITKTEKDGKIYFPTYTTSGPPYNRTR